MNRVYLLLGSNLNDRNHLISQSRKLVNEMIGEIISSSSVYESDPWGFQSENKFLNQVLHVDSRLDPYQVLDQIIEIEESLGRKRDTVLGYQSRIIDIDILFYNNLVIQNERLIIPHPRIHERMFVLIPMNELAEGLIHPVLNKTIGQLARECTDKGRVDKL
jgi:2-amino-4-hydroxy-6-hydroxymethyldihydropteridine diphosphokinase